MSILHYLCQHELDLSVYLKVIPLIVKKKGQATVKVHLSQTDYPKVTQVTGMFYTERAHIVHRLSDLVLLHSHTLGPESTPIYFGVKSFSAYVNWISKECADIVFVFLDGLEHVEEIKFNKCIYIEDTCLERLSSVENLQECLNTMEVVSCGNVTDKGIIALHRLRWVFMI